MQIKALFFVLYGILFVEATPFHPDSAIDLFKLNEVQEQLDFNLNNASVSTLISNETLEVAKPDYEENIPAIQGSSAESAVIFESVQIEHNHNHSHGHDNGHDHGHGNGHDHGHDHGHGNEHFSRKMGPVELGLRNVVSASGIATEELFMEMAAMKSETTEMINTKTQILTSHAMNEIFKSLSIAENEIKKNQECGRQFVSSFNAIFEQVESNLNYCINNLTIIGVNYNNQSIQVLSSISRVSEEIQNLPDSCEIAQHFAVGTFCTVNNLAEANNRVVMIVRDMRYITAVAKENVSKATASTVACHKNLVEAVLGKLQKLLNEVAEKCNHQNKQQNN